MAALAPTKFTIEREGQPYIDVPVVARPAAESECAKTIRGLFGRQLPRPIVIAFDRAPLKWGKGKRK